MIGGNVGFKCRLVVRCFKDTFQDLDAYVGTSSRPGQMLVNAIAADKQDTILVCFDVSQAFAK